jgi:hypothetical protein
MPLAAGVARADAAMFLPRSLDNGVYLELTGLREEESRHNRGRLFEWNDTFFREKVTLFSNGYVYHPRFLVYRLSLTGAYRQERFDRTSFSSDGYRSSTGSEYSARFVFLPEHPYNFELFALRYEPLFRERQATQIDNVATSRGAVFQYKKKPYFLTTRYTDNRRESEDSFSDVERLGIDGQYFKEFGQGNAFSLGGNLSPSRFDRSSGLEGKSLESSLSNGLRFRKFRLTSSVNQYSFDQDQPLGGRSESDQLGWQEQLTAYLWESLRAQLSYRYQDRESRVPIGSPGGGQRVYTSLARYLDLDLSHRLYRSLDTTYRYLRVSNDSSGGGGSRNETHSLAFNYVKAIPSGHLMAGASASRSDLDSSGRNDAVEEGHPAVAVPGSFQLNQANVEPATLAVYLRSPLPPFENVLLAQGVHYTVAFIGDLLEVNVLTLPPQFVVPETYEFRVSYSLTVGRFQLRNESRSYRLSFDLFNDLLTPYASRSEVDSRVLEGTLPGISPTSISTTLGITMQRRGLQARVEYQDLDWEVSPYRQLLTEARFVGSLGPRTTLNAVASRRKRDFPHGRINESASPLSETFDTISSTIQQRLFRRSLLLSLGGSYTRTLGSYESHATGGQAALSWRVGRVDLSLGANFASSEADAGALLVSDRTHRFYYLRIRREFF